MANWIAPLEEFARQLIGMLPAEKSLAAITICAVLYGGLCLAVSKTMLAAANLCRDGIQRTSRRKTGKAAG